MTTIKHRFSNVLAWAGFTVVPSLAFMLVIVPLIMAIVLFREISLEEIPTEPCPSCHVITQSDIDSSPTLRRLGANVGDWIREEDGKLVKDSYNAFKRKFLNALEEYSENILLLQLSFWLITGVINYIMVGSFRILPWKPIPASNDK